jgi:hypothetical protein
MAANCRCALHRKGDDIIFMKRFRAVLITGGIFLGICVTAASLIWHFIPPSCRENLLNETPSPDGKWVITVYERGCGATTRGHKMASLRPVSERFDFDRHAPFVAVDFADKIQVAWTDPTHLIVKLLVLRGPVYQENQVRGIQVEYVSDGVELLR